MIHTDDEGLLLACDSLLETTHVQDIHISTSTHTAEMTRVYQQIIGQLSVMWRGERQL